jgi:flagellar motility protein MotE (MotC chaperone)
MFMETPDTLLYVAGGAFLLGWLGAQFQSRKRDPRDDRIRNLDAELRIAQTEAEKSREEVAKLAEDLTAEKERIERRELVIVTQKQTIAELRSDLKESVKKTRELRGELSNRAAENVKSEVKLREVETELSVAQASTDLIATGVLDYSVAPEAEEEDDLAAVFKSAT